MKIKKKTETEAFQKLAKGNLRARRKKTTVEKSYVETTTITKIKINNPLKTRLKAEWLFVVEESANICSKYVHFLRQRSTV